MIGALANLWVGDRLGRRKTIALGGVVMIIGAILQTTSFSYAQLVVARIVTGLGNGLNVSILSISSHFLFANRSVRRQLVRTVVDSVACSFR